MSMPADTIPQRLVSQARLRPDSPAYFVRQAGSWKGHSWGAYFDEIKRVAKALIALGFEPGQTACILGFNRPEWVVMDLAAMCVGGAPAGIYTTCSTDEVQYIVAPRRGAGRAGRERASSGRRSRASASDLPLLRARRA